MNTLSTLGPPSPAEADPLLPFEREQLQRLQSAFTAAPERVRRAFLSPSTDPYIWFTPVPPMELQQ